MLRQEDIYALLDEMEAPIYSLYLDINPATPENQNTPPAWRIWLKNELRTRAAELGDEKRDLWKAIEQQVNDYLENELPKARGLALFSDGATLRDFALPLATENRSAFGAPLVTPLLWMVDEYEPYLIALIDQQQVRLMSAYLGSTGDEERMEIDLDEYDFGQKTFMPSSGSGGGEGITHGSNREAFEDMVGEHRSRFFRSVVERMEELLRKDGAQRIILGGSEESANAVRNLMPEKMAAQVVGVLPIPMRANGREIIERARPAAEEFERQYEDELVAQVIDFAKAGGRGAVGLKDVLQALEMQQVELLIVPWPMEDDALMQSLPERMRAASSQIELVHGEAAERLRAEGALAARLYYALPSR